MSPDTATALEAGRAKFNQRDFGGAHETWEAAWRREAGADRLLLQGLIMVAAGCVKATRDEPRGAVKLLTSALERLGGLHDDGGLALGAFVVKVTAALEEARAWEQRGGAPLVPSFTLDP